MGIGGELYAGYGKRTGSAVHERIVDGGYARLMDHRGY